MGRQRWLGQRTTVNTASSLCPRWTDGFSQLGQPDIVHWNNGLHDAGHNPNRSPVQIPVEMYKDNLAFILNRLKAMTPRIVWATITPVHPQRPFRDTKWAWRNEEIDRYNAAALTLMDANGVPVNDLHKCVWDNLETFLSEDQLHLSETGQKACAQAVADAVSVYLPRD